MRFDLTLGPSGRPARRRDPETPVRLLILGDLRGQSTDAATPLTERAIAKVDLDILADLLARYAPSVWTGRQTTPVPRVRRLPPRHAPGETARVRQAARPARAPAESQDIAAAVAELKAEAATTPTVAAEAEGPAAGDDQSTLERLLGQKAPEPAARVPTAAFGSVENLIRQTIALSGIPAADPQLPQTPRCGRRGARRRDAPRPAPSRFPGARSHMAGYRLARLLARTRAPSSCIRFTSHATSSLGKDPTPTSGGNWSSGKRKRKADSNSSEVSSQSTRPSLRAMKPSRLATMWIVT